VPSAVRRVDRGRRQGALLLRRIGEEIRDARRAAGLSQREVAAAAGLSQSFLSRVERTAGSAATFEQLAVVCAVVGLRLAAGAYPEGDPLRDRGQARLLERFKAELPPGARLPTEVPLGILGDLRAWDAMLHLGGQRCPIEAETALRDLQATDRRIALKMADTGVTTVILLVADTAANRAVLRAHRELLRDRYPLDGRAILRALRAGRCPEASGILVV
jgi:transcriptional regulator with XRE-family HTH domain